MGGIDCGWSIFVPGLFVMLISQEDVKKLVGKPCFLIISNFEIDIKRSN